MNPRIILEQILQVFKGEPGVPVVGLALKGTISVVVPFIIANLAGYQDLALSMAVGGLIVSRAGVGGTYRERFEAKIISCCLASAAVLLGTAAGDYWWLAVVETFVIVFLSGMGRPLGAIGSSVGLLSAVAFFLGLGMPGTWLEGAEKALSVFVGGIWGVAVTLLFWIFRPLKRFHYDVAACYAALAKLVSVIPKVSEFSGPHGFAVHETIASHHASIREAITRARNDLADVLTSEDRGPLAGDALLVLLRNASRLSGSLLAIGEALDVISKQSGMNVVHVLVNPVLGDIQQACVNLTDVIQSGKGTVRTERLVQAVSTVEQKIHLFIQEQHLPVEPHIAIENVVATLRAGLSHITAAVDASTELAAKPPGFGVNLRMLRGPFFSRHSMQTAIMSVQTHLTFQSDAFRHALRLALTVTIGVVIYMFFDLSHGFWTPLAALVVLRPDFGETRLRTVERTVGTVVGAVLATLLGYVFHGTVFVYVIIAFLAFAFFALRARKYGPAVAMITPLFILMIDLTNLGNWVETTSDRGLNTIIGATLAFIGGYVLWPTWERGRLTEQLAASLRANAAFVRAVTSGEEGKHETHRVLIETRRAAEIEVGNAEVSLQRILSEPKCHRGEVKFLDALVVYNRRLCRQVTILGAQILDSSIYYKLPILESFVVQVAEGLNDLARSVETGHPLIRPPRFEKHLVEFHNYVQERIVKEKLFSRKDNSMQSWPEIIRYLTMIDTQIGKIAREVTGMYQIIHDSSEMQVEQDNRSQAISQDASNT